LKHPLKRGCLFFTISETVSGGFGSNKLILESRATLDTIHIDEIDEAPVE
jgi:hypothetical protein